MLHSSQKVALTGAVALVVTMAAGNLLLRSRADAATQLQPATSDAVTPGSLGAWFAEHAHDPVAYTCALFDDADLVIIGEIHEIADNPSFVAELLAPAYHDAGVRVLATEFIRSSLNEAIEAVVTADEWNREAAINLFRAGAWPTWGYSEYVDILEAAWSVNDALPEDAEPLLVVGLDDDWKQIDLLSADRMGRFELVLAREKNMREVCERETLLAGRKAIAHVGLAHAAFVGGERLGSYLKSRYGDRVTNLMLHHSIGGGQDVSVITRTLDGALRESGLQRAAFAPAGSPLDALPDATARFAQMAGGDGRLRALAEHYAMLGTLEQQRPVTWIDGFVKPDRLEEAIDVLERLRWVEQGSVTTSEDIDAAMQVRLSGQ